MNRGDALKRIQMLGEYATKRGAGALVNVESQLLIEMAEALRDPPDEPIKAQVTRASQEARIAMLLPDLSAISVQWLSGLVSHLASVEAGR